MAFLKDSLEEGTRVELSFNSHIPGETEGCQLNFKYFKTNKKIYDLDFGWTNIIVNNFIEATSEFPLQRLDGTFMSFEKHFYMLEWRANDQLETYELTFTDSDQLFKIVTSKESVRQFGLDIKYEWEQAPKA